MGRPNRLHSSCFEVDLSRRLASTPPWDGYRRCWCQQHRQYAKLRACQEGIPKSWRINLPSSPPPGKRPSNPVTPLFSTRKYSLPERSPFFQRLYTLLSVFTSPIVMRWFSVSLTTSTHPWVALHPVQKSRDVGGNYGIKTYMPMGEQVCYLRRFGNRKPSGTTLRSRMKCRRYRTSQAIRTLKTVRYSSMCSDIKFAYIGVPTREQQLQSLRPPELSEKNKHMLLYRYIVSE